MISLTDNAVSAVKNALSQASGAPTGLRIMVEAGGCAGFKYMILLESTQRRGDLVIEQDGVRLFVEGRSQSLVSGLRIDFVTALNNSGFVFENPNAASKCACGKSFG
ncbi:HesB/IscA family protein [Methylobacterium nodulans]|uniref:Iron-sulfur cluster assembly accessory protein n=1 Tax=Methylobacterium nodulans (strain LMG 21967 / CNCM I-2342 / ORS 2060) TaxID=460265 RepID=B8ITI7_METNO|nr:iron-sulfur cluster assembly accessory protein [Methylobacterium nodulans]ACL58903.1 iron-sulfur cluster assembly accessory protein [Methylobacterium nodulans ORS 2060]